MQQRWQSFSSSTSSSSLSPSIESAISAIFAAIPSYLSHVYSAAALYNDESLHTKITQDFYQFLKKTIVFEPIVDQSLAKIASLAVSSPESCFSSIQSYLFKVSLDVSTSITQNPIPHQHYVNKLIGASPDFKSRAIIFCIHQKLLSTVVLMIVEKFNRENGDVLGFLIHDYFTDFFSRLSDQNVATLACLAAPIWEKVFYYLSIFLPDPTYDFILNSLVMHGKEAFPPAFPYSVFL